MSDIAIEARQLVKKFPARPGTGVLVSRINCRAVSSVQTTGREAL